VEVREESSDDEEIVAGFGDDSDTSDEDEVPSSFSNMGAIEESNAPKSFAAPQSSVKDSKRAAETQVLDSKKASMRCAACSKLFTFTFPKVYQILNA
jgi:hypothetical protein